MVITGDLHGIAEFPRLEQFCYEAEKNFDVPPYILVLGDFGGVWISGDTELIDACGRLPCKILFVDGNHENFDLLNQLPVSIWNDGLVHHVSKNVTHLMRGNIFSICGQSWFTFGGAVSQDRLSRIPHVSWWPQETASEEELKTAQQNLAKAHNCVDFICTHCGQMDAVQELHSSFPYCSKLKVCQQSILLSQLLDGITFRNWFCGHYHIDQSMGRHIFLYKTFYESR